MADTEKPRKAKRPKSAKKTQEDIPLATMDSTSNSKFNDLIQQAVDQSMSDARTEKKKKKKKGNTGGSVLESLRKGEGIQKEVDETVIANTYDPDDTKFEKSNKRKQKLLEERNRQNELEIIDETKGKTKKKKKPKDEKIENFDISELSPKDKTMMMSDLDTTVQKTPGKKKKKKTEEEPMTSARSEEAESIATTPKKKPRKKQLTEEEKHEAEMRQLEESIVTPTKKKKKKPAADEELETPGRTDEEVTPRKKKKKPVAKDELETPGRTDDEVTPRKKKKKKKKPDGETEDEGALSPSEEVVSPKGKKKKKKGVETDEEALSPSEEPTSPKGKGKKKKKKTEGETDEEALSPAEEVASPKGKDKKKKKKKKDGEEEEEVDDEDDKTDDTPKPKERKKKKKKGTEEADEVAEDDNTGLDVEDEGRILGVTIHRTDKLKNDFFIMHPMIRVHIFDELTGKYLPKQHKDRAVTAYYELQNENVKHILPIMTKPFDFKQNKSVLPVWEDLLVFNENYNYFIQDRPKTLVVFELLDFVSMNRTAQDDGHGKGWHRIAWAFLKIVGNNKKINTGCKVRLQLFEPPTGLRKKPDMEEVFQWWKETQRKTYPSTLYVTLKGIKPPEEVEPAERSLFATQQERGRMTYEDLKKSINWGDKKDSTQRNLTSWSRLAGQLCRLPNTLALALPTAKKGCYIVRFSHDGRNLACACHGREGFPILVYDIPSGRLKGKFSGHYGVVYDLSWSKMDLQIMSASSDGTVRIWDLQEFGEQQQKLLPHPAFVYCSQFHPRVETIAITGGFDQVIRVWDVGDRENSKFELRQELEDHVGYVNSICFSEDGQKMYSADSIGVIIIWNSFFTEMPSKRGIARDWTVYQKIEDAEIKGTAINYITLHPRERRLLVHCRDNIIRMFDLRIQRVMQKYIGALNFREQIRSAITPCGSFVFSGSEDNFAYAWNTDTGDQVIMYSELNYQNPVTDVHYHPRDHMVAFCSLGENHPVLVYSYNADVAQYDAGLSPRQISPVPMEMQETLGSPNLAEELATKGVLTRDEFNVHTAQRYDKVMRTLNKVTSQMTSTPTLDLPGMAPMSPRFGGSTMMTMSTGGYDSYGTPRSTMTGTPTMFSPHAQRSMSSVKQHQQFASQNLYMKGVDSWRPQFSEVGRHGARSTSPVFGGRAPQLNLTASQQGKAQFNFQPPPGKAAAKYDQVVVLYDYKAQRSDELDLFSGDVITVLHKDTENWWMGELHNGQQGFFPSNYVTFEDLLMDSHRSNIMSPDSSDSEGKKLTAVKSKSGDLKFISGEEDSGDDLLESNRTRRRRKHNSKDSASLSGTSESANLTNGKKPPRKPGQKVRINETLTESNA